jgi:serine/threonine-protein kinase
VHPLPARTSPRPSEAREYAAGPNGGGAAAPPTALQDHVNRSIGRARILLPLTGALAVMTTFLSLVARRSGDDEVFAMFVLVLAATVAGGLALLKHVRLLADEGIRLGDALGARKVISFRLPRRRKMAQTIAGVPVEVLNGPYGGVVQRAVHDREAIENALSRLSKLDREMLPDVMPTVRALVDRIVSLAPTVHELERDLQRDDLPRLEERIRAAERRDVMHGAGSDRALQLLQRQHATLVDLAKRRDSLWSQIESASLLLETIKLDLRRVGSAGVQASLNDRDNATQEARALSKDIGVVLSAAEDLRKM